MKLRIDSIPPESFQEELRVRSYEVGREGTVRPATLLRYFEHLATDASADAAFAPQWYAREGTAWVVRTMDVLIGSLPRFGEQLRAATWVAEYRHVQAIREYAIWNVTTGVLVARASARWAYIDRERGVPLRLPDAMTAGMRTYARTMAKRRLVAEQRDLAAEGSRVFEHTAHEYEVDSQQHINNCAYVDWLWEAAHQSTAIAGPSGAVDFQPRYYAIEYIRPTLVGEHVQIATRYPTVARNHLIVEQKMTHATSGTVCVRARTLYLRQRNTKGAS